MIIAFIYLALGLATAKWIFDNMSEMVEFRLQEIEVREEQLPTMRILFFVIVLLLWPMILAQLHDEF